MGLAATAPANIRAKISCFILDWLVVNLLIRIRDVG